MKKLEDEKITDNGGGNDDGGSLDVRRQMQIQEDVSVDIIICVGVTRLICMHRLNHSFTHFLCLSLSHASLQRINEEIMKEREEEIRNIHKGMHQVNEIYKVCVLHNLPNPNVLTSTIIM